MKLCKRKVAFAIPLLCRWHDKYLEACPNQFVHHRLVLSEKFRLERRHQYPLHAIFFQCLSEPRCVQINPLSHQVGPRHLPAIRDKCPENKLLFLDTLNTIGQGNTSRLRAIDGHGNSIIRPINLKRSLDHHSDHPYSQCTDTHHNQQ